MSETKLDAEQQRGLNIVILQGRPPSDERGVQDVPVRLRECRDNAAAEVRKADAARSFGTKSPA